MRITSETVRNIIQERIAKEDARRLLEAHLPPTDDVISKAKEDLAGIREKLPAITGITVTDVVTLEMEALAKVAKFKGIGRMKRASRKLRDLALEYKSESFALAQEIAELTVQFQKAAEEGLKELEKEKKAKSKSDITNN